MEELLSPLWDLSPLVAAFGTIGTGIAVSILLGLVVGFVSAMFGIGGGFVVTPFFHSVIGLSAPLAVAASMGQIACMSLSGIVEYARKGKVRYNTALLTLLGSLPASQWVAATVGNLRDSNLATQPVMAGLSLADLILLLSFGVFLALLGVYNIVRARRYTPESTTPSQAATDSASGANSNSDAKLPSPRRQRPLATIVMGVFFGALSVFLGIGGGFLAVPFFVYALKLEPAEAVATSFFCILITSILASVHYALADHLYFGLSLCVAAGSVFGAQAGSRFAIQVAPRRLLFSLGVLQLVIVTAYLLLKFV